MQIKSKFRSNWYRPRRREEGEPAGKRPVRPDRVDGQPGHQRAQSADDGANTTGPGVAR